MNEDEYQRSVGKALEKYPRKSARPYWWDRPTEADLESIERLGEDAMKQEGLPLKEAPIKGDPDKDAGVKSGPIRQTQGPEAATPHPAPESPQAAADPVEPVGLAPLGRDGLPLSKEIEPMGAAAAAATPVVQPQPFNESRVADMRKKFDVRAAEIADETKQLQEKLTAAKGIIRPGFLAQVEELDHKAKLLWDDIEGNPKRGIPSSELRTIASFLDKLHKTATGGIAFVEAPVLVARKFFSNVAFNYKQQQERAAREERQRLEAEQRAAQEKARAEELAALQAEGRVEEAKIIAETPLPPTVAPAAKEQAAIAPGVSVTASAKYKRMRDAKLFIEKVLVPNPERLLELFDPREGDFKRFGTSHLDKKSGEMSLPDIGIEWEIVGSTRTRHGSDGD